MSIKYVCMYPEDHCTGIWKHYQYVKSELLFDGKTAWDFIIQFFYADRFFIAMIYAFIWTIAYCNELEVNKQLVIKLFLNAFSG